LWKSLLSAHRLLAPGFISPILWSVEHYFDCECWSRRVRNCTFGPCALDMLHCFFALLHMLLICDRYAHAQQECIGYVLKLNTVQQLEFGFRLDGKSNPTLSIRPASTQAHCCHFLHISKRQFMWSGMFAPARVHAITTEEQVASHSHKYRPINWMMGLGS